MSSTTGLSARLGADAADPIDPATVKACCATAYGHDLVALFLGASYHPGGTDLTRHLAQLLQLGPGDKVLDVASGVGTTAFLVATECGADVLGIDLGQAQVSRARAQAEQLGLEERVGFQQGDAEQLPVPTGMFDAVISECALCTFPDKRAAAAEMNRVVRPGGRVGISDVWLDPDRLDPELRGLAGRVACLADARPIDEVRTLLDQAGLRVTHVERHDDAMVALIDQIRIRLRALRLADLPLLRDLDLRRGIELAGRAAEVVERGHAGYVLLTATKNIDG
jgi:arsenite methyltransferase